MDGRRKLAEFIAANSTQAQFAREVACSQPHLTLFLQGKRGLSIGLAGRISRATRIPIRMLVSADVAELLSEPAE
jgi:transcriptional regulator with XRE-family HTH domain